MIFGLLGRRRGKKKLEERLSELFSEKDPMPKPGRKLGGKLVPMKKTVVKRELAHDMTKAMLRDLGKSISGLSATGANPTRLAELKNRRRLLLESLEETK